VRTRRKCVGLSAYHMLHRTVSLVTPYLPSPSLWYYRESLLPFGVTEFCCLELPLADRANRPGVYINKHINNKYIFQPHH
jgi:hypothetical protein